MKDLGLAVKAVFDFTASAMGIIIISPLLLYIAYRIKKESPGPIIFKQKRIGKGGRHFYCYKFRTMVVNAEAMLKGYLEANPQAYQEWEQSFKLKDDPRITPIGHLLRKTSLDELPQLFNVLQGEMSLVGPRPMLVEEEQHYGKYFVDYCSVKPGITGPWQVSGRNDMPYEERVAMVVWYAHHRSFFLDMKILWKTVGIVLDGKGAY